MKQIKKGVPVIVLLLLIIAAIVFISNRPSISMKQTFQTEDTVAAKAEMKLEKDGKIKVRYESSVISGELFLTLYDASGNAVAVFETGKKGSEEMKLEKGSYVLRAEGEGFKGKYCINIYKK